MLSKKKGIEATVDIIIPVFNEEKCINEVLKRLLALRRSINYLDISFIFINDGSSDNSLNMLLNYAGKHKFVKVINFSRNFGHQIAVTAGLDYSDAEYVMIIDADLQDPPELIEDMFRLAKQGNDVVYGKRISRRGENSFKRISAKIFYRLISRICDIDIPSDAGDFRFMNRKVLNSLKNMRERHRFIRGMVPWVGFRSTPLYYHRDVRFAGETKYPFRKMLRFAKDAIFSFSSTPLKIANFIGFIIVGLGLLGGLLLLYLRFFTKYSVPGITAVLITIILIGGIQIIMIGVIGEYIGRIFEETKKRPLYVVETTKNIPHSD